MPLVNRTVCQEKEALNSLYLYTQIGFQNQTCLMMTDKQKRVYEAVRILGPVRPHTLAKEMGYTESAYIMQQLLALKKKGYIIKTGSGKLTKYELNEEFRANDI